MRYRFPGGPTGVHAFRSLAILASLLAACNHQDPFPSGDPPDNGPPSTTPPLQLTFSPGFDRSPAWSVDGATLAYAFRREDGGAVGDRCIATLPAAGGTRSASKCLVAADSDTVRVLGPVALGPGDLVAWVDARSLVGRRVPDREYLRIGTMGDHDTGTVVRTFPDPVAGTSVHATATSLTWLSPTKLAYIGNDRVLLGPCRGCPPDTLLIAREAILLDLSTSPATATLIPNTAEVTSLSASSDGLSLYLTRAGDSRVFQRVLAGNTETVVHDFGSTIARDANVRGNVLTAVIGGRVNYIVDPIIGARQVDSGGFLRKVDLTNGNETAIDFPDRIVTRPALSPSGSLVVAEAFDTLSPLRQADLWQAVVP